jgi:hypothetical protein
MIHTRAVASIADVGSTALPVGTVLTIISNTANTSISGTFGNLPDGATMAVGNNTFQASYKGGDGNAPDPQGRSLTTTKV